MLPTLTSVAHAERQDGICCSEIRESFGRLAVPEGDTRVARDYGHHIESAARKFLALETIAIDISDERYTELKWGDLSDGRSVYPWRFSYEGIADVRNPPNEIFPHEVAHDLLRRHYFPVSHAGLYGTDAPDWLDEAVAVAFELESDKAVRRCEALSLLKAGRFFELTKFLTMEHPDLRRLLEAGTQPDQITYRAETDADTPVFYSMALSFPEYLASKTGNDAILGEVIEAQKSGWFSISWVNDRVVEHGKSKSQFDLDAEYRKWILSSQQYSCG